MAFFLFILVNATLFIRPAEVFAMKEAENVYQFLIVACLILATPDVLAHLTARPLVCQPITLCVLGVMCVVPLAFLAAQNLGGAASAGIYFLKVVVYYLLFVSLVTTPARLRTFLAWLLIFGGVLALLSVLNMEGVIHLETLKPLAEIETDQITGEHLMFQRLLGSGIFADPNEMCGVLAALVPLCLYAITDRRSGILRILWLAELALFGYAIYLTRSRGGFLALIGGLGTIAWARFGWRRALVIGALGLPVLALVMSSRQTNINTGANTAQSRIGLWSDWMMVFRGNPLLGEGMRLVDMNNPESILTAADHLAHNSYLQAFADMGVAGGVFFLGAFILALWSLRRLSQGTTLLDPDLRHLQPYLLGCIAAYAVGLVSLSLCYVVPTYLILGLAVVFTNMAESYPPVPRLQFDGGILARLAGLSVAYLVCLYVFVRVFIDRI